MDIHRPKAAHSWREFLIEIATIICGILIALGLEQVVEVMRTAREVSEARDALHREMERDLYVAMLWQREHPCWLRALDAAKAWAAGTGARPRYPTGLMVNYQSTVWDATKGGAVTHMPLDERLALAKFYDTVATDNGVIGDHRAKATEIGGYLDRDRLTDQEAAGLARLVGQVRWMSDVEFENGRRVLDDGAPFELTPAPPDLRPRRESGDFCRSFAPAR